MQHLHGRITEWVMSEGIRLRRMGKLKWSCLSGQVCGRAKVYRATLAARLRFGQIRSKKDHCLATIQIVCSIPDQPKGKMRMDVDASRLRHLANMLNQATGNSSIVDNVLQKANLSRKDVATTSRTVDPQKECHFVREACDALGDPTFGVRAGLSMMRTITDTNFRPIEIRFDHEAKASTKEILRLAEFPVVFGAEKMEIVLSLSSLDLPVPTYDVNPRRHLTELGDRLLQDQPNPNPSLRAKIEGLLASSLPGRLVPADEVASNLGMSRRTFARRLKDDGLSFRGIVDDLRSDLAKTYLKGGFSISEISFYLDYTDQAAFSTGFKRRAGSSPSDFKNSRK